MKFFGKNKTSSPRSPAGRRRPLLGGRGQDVPSRQNSAFSYYSQRSYDPSNIGRRDIEEIAEGRTTTRATTIFGRHRRLLGLSILLLIPMAIYLLSLSNKPKVVLLQDKTTAYFLQQPLVYQQAAERSLGRSLINRNKLTVDTASVRSDLLTNFPEIKNVSVALPTLGNQPLVYIEPYKPSFILTTTSSNAFLLDATGRALAMASQVPDIDKLAVPTLQDRTGTPVNLGKRALPSTTVRFTESVVAALKAEGVNTSSLVLPPGAYELDAYIEGSPYFVKFNLQGDALQQAGTFLAVKLRIDGVNIKPAQYIDVRVPERAYYK